MAIESAARFALRLLEQEYDRKDDRDLNEAEELIDERDAAIRDEARREAIEEIRALLYTCHACGSELLMTNDPPHCMDCREADALEADAFDERLDRAFDPNLTSDAAK
jgi:hypothetical protein